MDVYVVIIQNEECDEEFDTCGVFSSLELALSQTAPEGWKVLRIEIWELNNGYVKSVYPQEEENEREEE